MISNGLAKVIRYKQDDEKRSSKYDELLSAESRAQKKAIGIHSTKEVTTMKIADVSGVIISLSLSFIYFLMCLIINSLLILN